MMNDVGAFPRLLELLQVQGKEGRGERADLNRLLMNILYEMSRIQRVKIEDLGTSRPIECGGHSGLTGQYSWTTILSGACLSSWRICPTTSMIRIIIL